MVTESIVWFNTIKHITLLTSDTQSDRSRVCDWTMRWAVNWQYNTHLQPPCCSACPFAAVTMTRLVMATLVVSLHSLLPPTTRPHCLKIRSCFVFGVRMSGWPTLSPCCLVLVADWQWSVFLFPGNCILFIPGNMRVKIELESCLGVRETGIP